jgi:two-component system, sensor histidine kinase
MSDKPKLLIVDDVERNLFTLKLALQKLDVEVLTATSGESALKIASNEKLILVLLDVQMPGMDGYEVADALHAQKQTQFLPIIFVTGISQEKQQVSKGYNTGAIDYLFKPLDVDILRKKVQSFLDIQTAHLLEIEKEQNRQNRQLIEELKHANQYKSDFLMTISHELRTPLNAILVLSKMLVDDEAEQMTDDQSESISTIYRSGKNLLKLINDLLDLAKMEAGNVVCCNQDFSPHEMLNTIAFRIKPKLAEKNLSLTLEIDDSVPDLIEADVLHLDRVINNIISNAIKFTEKGEITIKVSAPEGCHRLSVSVADTGIGVSPECLEHMFDAFRQADSSKTRKFGGTGLGLCIALNLVKLMQGEIKVESALGKGSCFTVDIPFTLSE